MHASTGGAGKKSFQKFVQIGLFGHYGTKQDEARILKQQKLERERELSTLSRTKPVGEWKRQQEEAAAAKAAEEKRKREEEEAAKRAIEEAARLEEERKAEEERRAIEEAARLEAEKKEKDRQEKAAIEAELRNRLSMPGRGGAIINGWAKLDQRQQQDLVESAWLASMVSESEIKQFIMLQKKREKGNAREKEEKAKNKVGAMIDGKRLAAIDATFKDAKSLVDASILAEKQVVLAADKQVLLDAIDARGASGDTADLLKRAVREISLATGTDATIDKGYLLKDLGDACDHWKRLYQSNFRGSTVGAHLQIITAMWSPGGAYEIYWKERGQNLERTKNLMATVDGHTVNIHIRPGRWTWPKRRGGLPDGD